MSYLMRAGGFPIWIVLLIGLACIGAAVAFARRPRESMLGFFRGLSRAELFAVCGAVAANLSATFYNVPHRFGEDPDRDLYAMIGVSESLSPAILGFALLTVAWVIAGIGVRRLGAAGV